MAVPVLAHRVIVEANAAWPGGEEEAIKEVLESVKGADLAVIDTISYRYNKHGRLYKGSYSIER
jgi:hypothetical protein